MIQEYNRTSFYWGVPGILLRIGGLIMAVASSGTDMAIFGLFLAIAGTALLFVGLGYYAKAKDRSWAWCFLSLIGILGLICLLFLEDRAPSQLQQDTENAVNSRLAVWSLILGIISFPLLFVGVVVAVPGLIMGIIALRKISEDPRSFKGRWYAIIGIILSAISIFITVFVLILIYFVD